MSIDRDKWKGSTLYAWRWQGEGYNWCRADNAKEALDKAARMGLKVREGTLVEGAAAEQLMESCEKQYKGLFD